MENLIFWFDNPPTCSKGIWKIVNSKWEKKCYFICISDFREDRLKVQSTEANSNELPLHINIEHKEIVDFIFRHRNDIHIFNGYKGKTSRYLKYLLKINKNAKVLVWAERPGDRGKRYWPKFTSILYKLYHSVYAYKYSNKISAILAIGIQGVEAYCNCGWSKDKIFPFLYVPDLKSCPRRDKIDKNKKIRFVYLGRFSARGKGLDTLVKAYNFLNKKNFTLDLVGGYGDYNNITQNWIRNHENLTYGGTWPIQETSERLTDYDVCIIPSRFEGWNVTTNEAISAGIGCIITNQAVSQELIEISGAGKIIPANSPKQLAKAMQSVIDNPEVIIEWKKRAVQYRKQISPEICAEYFIDVLKYLFDDTSEKKRPEAPWLTKG